MKKERFKSSRQLVYITLVGLGVVFWAGDVFLRPFNEILLGILIASFWLLVVVFLKLHTYLEIRDSRTLINSGYRTFGKDTIDIFDIRYIYRHPEFVIRSYGSRMVFYIKGDDGKLHQSSLREVNYSNDTLVQFLKRIKEIRSTIELDSEYEKIVKGEMFLNDASESTVASVEKRLKAKGEKW